MNMVEKVIKFCVSESGERNAWLSAEGVRLYVRRTPRFLDEAPRKTLDIANIENTKPGKGWFTKFLPELESRLCSESDFAAIYVESILNERLVGFLIKNGYTLKPQSTPRNVNYYKLLGGRKNDSKG